VLDEAWIVLIALMNEYEVSEVELSDRQLVEANRVDKLRIERLYDRAGIRVIVEE